MIHKSIKLHGSYIDHGKIQLTNNKVVDWFDLSTDRPPSIPYGTKVEMSISYEQNDYLNGEGGIVWATYERYQAEIIKDALLAQNIACEVHKKPLEKGCLYLLRISEERNVEAAMDFIWRENTGLNLQPDWMCPPGTENESFLRWVSDK